MNPNKILKSSVASVAKSIFQYMNLGSWLNQKVVNIIASKKLYTIESVKYFWAGVIHEILNHGDRIKFKKSVLTEWVPRLPGQVWLSICKEDVGDQSIFINDEILQGNIPGFAYEGGVDCSPYGVVRFPFGPDTVNYAVLSVTTPDAWCCDCGVPVVVNNAVYDAFLKRKGTIGCVEAEFEAILCYGELPVTFNERVHSIETTEKLDLSSITKKPYDVPSIYLRLASPLDAKFSIHNSHPPGMIYSLVKKNTTWNIHGNKLGNLATFINGLTVGVDLTDHDSINTAIDIIHKGSIFALPGTEFREPYIKNLISNHVLMDFDSRRRRFPNALVVATDDQTENKNKALTTKVLREIKSGEVAVVREGD